MHFLMLENSALGLRSGMWWTGIQTFPLLYFLAGITFPIASQYTIISTHLVPVRISSSTWGRPSSCVQIYAGILPCNSSWKWCGVFGWNSVLSREEVLNDLGEWPRLKLPMTSWSRFTKLAEVAWCIICRFHVHWLQWSNWGSDLQSLHNKIDSQLLFPGKDD